MYTYIDTHICIYAYTHIYTYIYMNGKDIKGKDLTAYKQGAACVYIYTCMHDDMYVYVLTYI